MCSSDLMVDMLESLQGKRIPLVVLSNKPHGWTVDIMQHFFGNISFAVVRGALPHVPHKPNAAGALQVAEAMGIKASQCYFVGDSNVDMQTAVNAGMYPVGVTWGFRDEEELLHNGAKHLVHTAGELLQLPIER